MGQIQLTTEFSKICKKKLSILHDGFWKNLKLNGFERIVNSKTIKTPWNRLYPLKPWPPYYFWNIQNYTGEWFGYGLKNKNLLKLDLCLQNTHLHFVGDSRTRQLYRSFKQYLLENETFYDTQTELELNDRIPNIVNISWNWSQTFSQKRRKKFMKALNSGLQAQVLPSIYSKIKRIDKNSKLVVIVGEQILHEMEHVFKNIQSVELIKNYNDKIEEWVFTKIIEPLIFGTLGKIIDILVKFDFLSMIFVGSHFRLVDREKMVLYKSIIDEYNKQMSSLIENVKTGYNFKKGKLEFISVLSKISIGNNFPLVLDGTHLNWPISQYNNRSTFQVPTHLAFDEILLNYLCQ